MASSRTSSRNFIPMANKYDRIVLLIDMDCFYCQVEEKLDPSLKNQPIAVVQYNAWKGGGIIAVNYAARAKGVTRHMRGDEAKEHCPEIQLVKVPNVREKADLTKYREAGKEVANVLQRFTPLLERASVDEAYLDITTVVDKRLQEMNKGTFILQPQELASTYVVGYQTIGEFVTTVTNSFITNTVADDNAFHNGSENEVSAVRQSNIRLLIGASIANEIRCAVKAETSYECSAGIAHNKILAKVACGINKPNKQTLLPLDQISSFFETLPVGKIKGLGAKFGEEICERLNIRYLGQLLKFTEIELQKKIDEKNGSWLYNVCRGIDLEAVTPRFYSKSIGCCKKFPGRNNITGLKTLQHWLKELANEINERLERDICENNRRAKQMVVNFIQEFDGELISSSRSSPLQCYDVEILEKTSLEIIKANTKQFFRYGSQSVLNNPITFLGISVGKFETISNSQNNIQEMFAQQAAKKQKTENPLKDETQKSSLTANLVNSEVEPVDISDECMGKQIPEERKSQSLKHYFINALKKQQHNEIETTSSNYSDNDNLVVQESSGKLEYKSNNYMNIENIPQDELAIPNDDKHNDDRTKKIPQESFFARALRQRAETITNKSNFLNLNPCDANNKNENQNPKSNDTNSNDINEINLIPYEENKINIEAEDRNSYMVTSDCIIDSSPKMVSKPSEQIFDALLLNNTPINLKRKLHTISDTEELNQTSYLTEYAEFATPEFKPELLQFTNCSKCNAKILNDPTSVQTHEDHHYAQELSKKQREEFKSENRSKIHLSKSPPGSTCNKNSKKVQLQNSSLRKTAGPSITKFLKPSSSSMLFSTSVCDKNQNNESSISHIEICDICKLPTNGEQLSEHKDFHMAKELQRKLNQLEVHTVEVVRNSSSHSARKSIKLSMNLPKHHTKAVHKPITKFFTQSNM